MRKDIRIVGKALIILSVWGVVFCPNEKIRAEEKPAAVNSLAEELRPSIEFKAGELRDPFIDTVSQIKEPEPEIVVEAAPAPVIEEKRAPDPPQLSVQGMIWGSNVPCVIINGQILKQGEFLDDVKITKIGKEGVEILYKEWGFTLPPPGVSIRENKETEADMDNKRRGTDIERRRR